MANQLRFRSGQVHLHKLRVDAGTVLHAGDMVFLDSDDVKPASAFPWNTDLPATQSAFAAAFLGITHQQSAAGDAGDVSVDLSPLSVYEFDVHPAAYEVGDMLAPDELSQQLMNQQLEAAVSGTQAIARAAEHRPAGSSTLRVTFASAFHTSSANANAAIG